MRNIIVLASLLVAFDSFAGGGLCGFQDQRSCITNKTCHNHGQLGCFHADAFPALALPLHKKSAMDYLLEIDPNIENVLDGGFRTGLILLRYNYPLGIITFKALHANDQVKPLFIYVDDYTKKVLEESDHEWQWIEE